MKESYRINVRFDLGNEREARAAEFLQTMGSSSRNRFIVDAIIRAMDGNSGCRFSEDLIRRIIREELRDVSVTRAEPEKKTAPPVRELTSEQKAKSRECAFVPQGLRRLSQIGSKTQTSDIILSQNGSIRKHCMKPMWGLFREGYPRNTAIRSCLQGQSSYQESGGIGGGIVVASTGFVRTNPRLSGAAATETPRKGR